jgi:hypothetical protein
MEPERSLPSLQELSTGLYPEIDESSTHTHPIWIYFLSDIFPSGFPTKTLYELLPHAWHIPCMSHPPWLSF